MPKSTAADWTQEACLRKARRYGAIALLAGVAAVTGTLLLPRYLTASITIYGTLGLADALALCLTIAGAIYWFEYKYTNSRDVTVGELNNALNRARYKPHRLQSLQELLRAHPRATKGQLQWWHSQLKSDSNEDERAATVNYIVTLPTPDDRGIRQGW